MINPKYVSGKKLIGTMVTQFTDLIAKLKNRPELLNIYSVSLNQH